MSVNRTNTCFLQCQHPALCTAANGAADMTDSSRQCTTWQDKGFEPWQRGIHTVNGGFQPTDGIGTDLPGCRQRRATEISGQIGPHSKQPVLYKPQEGFFFVFRRQ